MVTWNKIRTSLFARKPDIDSSVRAAVKQVVTKKIRVKAFKENGATMLVRPFLDEYFTNPERNEEPIADDNDQKIKLDWLE